MCERDSGAVEDSADWWSWPGPVEVVLLTKSSSCGLYGCDGWYCGCDAGSSTGCDAGAAASWTKSSTVTANVYSLSATLYVVGVGSASLSAALMVAIQALVPASVSPMWLPRRLVFSLS